MLCVGVCIYVLVCIICLVIVILLVVIVFLSYFYVQVSYVCIIYLYACMYVGMAGPHLQAVFCVTLHVI